MRGSSVPAPGLAVCELAARKAYLAARTQHAHGADGYYYGYDCCRDYDYGGDGGYFGKHYCYGCDYGDHCYH